MAFETAKYLLCNGAISDSCQCDSCIKFPHNHPDFLCIGKLERAKVADVDQILEFASVAPFLSDKKVAVIDNAEDMTWEASNRLLKTLEEPPEGFTFFVVSSDPERLLGTIRSRCIRYTFGTLSQENTINVFYKRLGFDLPKARLLGWLAAGSSIDIFSNAGLYLKHRELALDFVSGLRFRKLIESLDFVDKMVWKELPIFIDMAVILMTDVLLLKNGIEDIVNADLRDQLQKISEGFNDKALLSATNTISQAKRNVHLNVNMNLAMKNMLIKSYPLLSA